MVLNISSRNCELIIGSQNWTPWISFDQGIILGYPEYETDKGLMPVTGTITLVYSKYDPNLPSSPYFRSNPSQWRRTQTLSIRVANSSGTLTYLPCSGQLLYLLKPPQRPAPSMDGKMELSLSVGCRLSLEDFPPEPNQDISGVVAGTPLDRGTIISNILTYLGIANSIGSLPYPIDYPLPKIDGNWIGMCGQLAASAGYYLRCNSAGTVIAEPVVSSYSSVNTASYLIGNDEKSWLPIGDIAERPIEKTVLTGIKKTVTPVDTSPQEVREVEALGVTFEFYDGLDGRAFSNARATKRITSISNVLVDPNLFEETTVIREALGLTFEFYNGLDSRAFSNALGIKSKTVTRYFLQNGIPFKIEKKEQEALGLTFEFYNGLDGRAFSNALGTKRITTDQWTKVQDGLWNKTTVIREALGLTFEFYNGLDGRAFSNALGTRLEVTVPDTSGPPTNFGNASSNTTNETQITATVIAQQLADDSTRQRQRTIDVPFAISEAQLMAYGDRFNQILTGRSLGWQFGGAITDPSLSADFKPFNQVSVQDEDLLYYLKLDAIQYGLNGAEAWCIWHGIEVGTAAVSSPTDISKPVTITVGIFVFSASIAPYVEYESIGVEAIAVELNINIRLPDAIAINPFTTTISPYMEI